MFAFLRGASIVAAVAWWSPTHEPPASLRSGADGSRPVHRGTSPPFGGQRIDAAEILTELGRTVRDAEAMRRALAGSTLAEAAGDELLARSRPLRGATAASDGQAGQSDPRPREKAASGR